MEKILFIGNSLSGHIWDTFSWMVETHSREPFHLDIIWGGGATLEGLINNGRALKFLDKEKWDRVVLQDQSQTPALPGPPQESFFKSVGELSKKVREIGAEPVLYETWGHQGGDQQNLSLYPDYESMQQALSGAYAKASADNNLRVIPVGQIWKEFKSDHPQLFSQLVEDDLYHPSNLGKFFNSCIFFHLLLKQPTELIHPKADLDDDECLTLIEFVSRFGKTS